MDKCLRKLTWQVPYAQKALSFPRKKGRRFNYPSMLIYRRSSRGQSRIRLAVTVSLQEQELLWMYIPERYELSFRIRATTQMSCRVAGQRVHSLSTTQISGIRFLIMRYRESMLRVL